MSRRALFGNLFGRQQDDELPTPACDTGRGPAGAARDSLGSAGEGSPQAPIRRRGAVTGPRGVLLATAPDAVLPRPHAQDGCTSCEACTTICPTDALSWLRSRTATALFADPEACTACGECTRVCPEDVLSLVCPLPVEGLPDRGNDPVLLTRVAHRRCGRCGRTLSADEAGECTSCRSRRAMLDDVWAQDDRRLS